VSFYSLIWDLKALINKKNEELANTIPFYSLIWDFGGDNGNSRLDVIDFLFPYMGLCEG